MARLGRSERVLYEERHWVPWWIVAAVFLLPVAGFIAYVLVPSVRNDPDALSPLAAGALGVAFGLVFAGFLWANHARRVIRVTDRALRIGSRAPIPLDAIDGVQVVRGGDVRALRRELTRREGAELGIAGIVEPGLAELALGASSFAGRYRRAGAIAPPWMRSAALVLTKTGRTRVWLLGSRDAGRIVTALDRARTSAASDLRPGEEGGEGDLE